MFCYVQPLPLRYHEASLRHQLVIRFDSRTATPARYNLVVRGLIDYQKAQYQVIFTRRRLAWVGAWVAAVAVCTSRLAADLRGASWPWVNT